MSGSQLNSTDAAPTIRAPARAQDLILRLRVAGYRAGNLERRYPSLNVEEGSLYPALYRMERDGWIDADWGTSELGRKAKFYQITDKGRRQLRAETKEFASFVAAVAPLLLPA